MHTQDFQKRKEIWNDRLLDWKWYTYKSSDAIGRSYLYRDLETNISIYVMANEPILAFKALDFASNSQLFYPQEILTCTRIQISTKI